jgi:hypothetical protein
MEEILKTENQAAFAGIVARGKTLMMVQGGPKVNTTPILEVKANKGYAPWFTEDNLYPKKVLDALKADPELFPFINSYAKSLYSGGVIYGTWRQEGNTAKFDRIYDAEINQWLEDSNISLYLQEAFLDGKTFSNAWAELAYDGRGAGSGHIAQLSIQDAVFCRFGTQNSKGIKDQTHVAADWETAKEWKSYPTIDPYFRPLQQIEELKKDVIYYPLVFPGIPGNIFYQVASWHPLLESDIMELSKLMIQFKKYYLQNGMAVKYHVEVAQSYFSNKYKDKWAKGSDKDKTSLMQQEVDAFNDVMTGIEKTGKTFMSLIMDEGVSMHKFNPRLEAYSSWKITPIDIKSVSGEYTNDMNQNTLIKLRALDYDPAIAGGISGDSGKIGGGSGSDARVAWNIHQIKNKPMQEIVLSPLNKVIKHINGWEKRHKNLKFMTESLFLATQDQVPPAERM